MATLHKLIIKLRGRPTKGTDARLSPDKQGSGTHATTIDNNILPDDLLSCDVEVLFKELAYKRAQQMISGLS